MVSTMFGEKLNNFECLKYLFVYIRCLIKLYRSIVNVSSFHKTSKFSFRSLSLSMIDLRNISLTISCVS